MSARDAWSRRMGRITNDPPRLAPLAPQYDVSGSAHSAATSHPPFGERRCPAQNHGGLDLDYSVVVGPLISFQPGRFLILSGTTYSSAPRRQDYSRLRGAHAPREDPILLFLLKAQLQAHSSPPAISSFSRPSDAR